MPTFGGHSRLRQSKLTELLTGIGDAIDAAGGSFTMGYATIAIVAKVGDHRPTDRPDPAS